MPKDIWTPYQRAYLLEHLEKETFRDIGTAINKSEQAVQLYVFRNRIPMGPKVSRNLLMEILALKFIKPEYFHPNRSFYNAVRIGQRRWWNLYFGRASITEEEYRRVVCHLQISMEDAFEARQLSLFDQ
jgi:hypothetical protein